MNTEVGEEAERERETERERLHVLAVSGIYRSAAGERGRGWEGGRGSIGRTGAHRYILFHSHGGWRSLHVAPSYALPPRP